MAPPVFPSLPGITFPVKRSTRWSGVAHDALSGKRVRASYMSYPIYIWEVTFNFLRTQAAYLEWQTLGGFINSMSGQSGLFLYEDPNDFNAGPNQVFGVGDGVSTTFRLVRSLGSFVEPVFFPDVPIPSVRVNGVTTSAYTLDATNNIVFNTAPPAGQDVDWTGTFKFPCRFDLDVFDMDNFALNLFDMKSIKFSSEKLV